MNLTTHRRRWGDNDHYFGPFTYARDRHGYRPLAIILQSGEDEYPGAQLRISGFGHTFITAVPHWLIGPYVGWRDLSHADWAKPGPGGRKGYVVVDRREYGFTLSDGHMSVKLGRQTMDSSTTRDWGCFLPWTQWRHVKRRYFDAEGNVYYDVVDSGTYNDRPHRFEVERMIEKSCPAKRFSFKDFDGEEGIASVRISEGEWAFGTGLFKWLSLFRPRKKVRALDIEFSIETGRRKGSWKGGTLGSHSAIKDIDEWHKEAFQRYCSENNMTFIGEVMK
ncbi:hypothetical protein [Aminobacter aminovorans]|uniref:SLAIN-domain containing protein n=1 Tax=Aminobacter aminovorans TaxID=83263 RepID=A0AAC8YMQ6_AMIAI|nr:hypothetical protein [Aminobacter aminovorans]AMS41157.1 SLAIN-domain containing protein [Aminobacter aminovorans]MBB3705861.1 hypothetical protein [Aminobacter aminovorans]